MSGEEPAQGSSSSIYKGTTHLDEPVEPQHYQQDEEHDSEALRQPHQSSGPTSIFVKSFRALFGFRKTSLTIFVGLTLFLVFISLPLARDYALVVPSPEPSELTSAWFDLQKISHKPHPYVSHANDEVHDYLMERVTQLAKSSVLNITIDDDKASNLTYFDIHYLWKDGDADFNPLHYFESSNILVKIEGKDSKLDGILLSAHYDSVGTSYGTTDDGAGVASLLGVLEHYALTGKQPLRTIVFNFNNNEEFGLYGAMSFFKHKWSKLVKYFINLEGTGTGERAALFRTTDYGVAQLYSSVRSPFGSSIFQQAFATGVIRSETDYRIYHENGLRGFDIAFYKPRDLYHTVADSIKHTSKGALWHMLGNTLDLTKSLANAKDISDDESGAVFFDVLGLQFFVTSLNALITANIVLLTIVPIALIFFGIIIHKRQIWTTGYSWFRLPISFALGLFFANAVNKSIYYLNGYIVSRNFISPLIAVSATFLLVNYGFLTISQSLAPVHDFKLIITLEVFVVLWVLLLYFTIREKTQVGITGAYLVTIIYALYSISTILGLFGIAVASQRKKPLNDNQYLQPGNVSTRTTDEFDENTPLIDRDDVDEEEEAHPEHNSFTYDWSLQYLVLVPIPLLLSYISVDASLVGLCQTIQESLHSGIVFYEVLLASGIALTVPLLSFAYKLNFLFAIVLILSIIIGGSESILQDPFTSGAPMKVRFAQTIDLDGTASPQVEILGRTGFLYDIISDLPSVKEHHENVTCTPSDDGNEICSYQSAERPYLFNGTLKDNSIESYLTVDILKTKDSEASPYSPMKAEIRINVKENRNCLVTFNTSAYSPHHGKSPVRVVTIYDSVNNVSLSSNLDSASSLSNGFTVDSSGNKIFKWLSGIDQIALHKTNWNSGYHLGLQWVPKWLEDGEDQPPSDSPLNKLGVHVTCHWGEWDDVSIVDGVSRRIIPAYDELLQYSPEATSISNLYEGLVKIDKYIEL
ncbi:Pff1p [Cyberlindnera jadinii NRRL Y-1542]|uniref:Peptide hydrolase n=1 Tax=Cyberlindnera jadinii (strain ATCC 18201 / CBS 1600 / BCRC 20928 / JCM 3617 / NBRC 0987 / NRRL Y-1542) TaxID=983966 RepID=A0A1E4RU64_CYBJN|nr:Zn-dependent exopeptidase [Cyberlindnera jadinii NRRL Y-1542]ODV70817.1 Zn-dependent exopeptidase [Cyberlindnera jadinii NRRL Y-1542]